MPVWGATAATGQKEGPVETNAFQLSRIYSQGWNAARKSKVTACCSVCGAAVAAATSWWTPANVGKDGVDEIHSVASKQQGRSMSDFRDNILGRAFQVVPGVEFNRARRELLEPIDLAPVVYEITRAGGPEP